MSHVLFAISSLSIFLQVLFRMSVELIMLVTAPLCCSCFSQEGREGNPKFQLEKFAITSSPRHWGNAPKVTHNSTLCWVQDKKQEGNKEQWGKRKKCTERRSLQWLSTWIILFIIAITHISLYPLRWNNSAVQYQMSRYYRETVCAKVQRNNYFKESIQRTNTS